MITKTIKAWLSRIGGTLAIVLAFMIAPLIFGVIVWLLVLFF